MLYYDLINEKDGVDYGEGKDMVRTSKDISKECHCCNFYYFVTRNFRHHKYFCDGCFFCRIYEKDSKGLLTLRIIKTTKGSFGTVSSYFYKEVEEALTKTDLNNVNVAAFTTLLHVTSDITRISATDAVFVEYTRRTAKDY